MRKLYEKDLILMLLEWRKRADQTEAQGWTKEAAQLRKLTDLIEDTVKKFEKDEGLIK